MNKLRRNHDGTQRSVGLVDPGQHRLARPRAAQLLGEELEEHVLAFRVLHQRDEQRVVRLVALAHAARLEPAADGVGVGGERPG